ncbi:hypothetical protein EVAR_49271_1 [Eumeta japonica]|uniref:Uncharacterized protein n=1 Tax=Eumeta variegata TaxID=151549 RepID=A0A4C1YKE0_EUMVA|nr:hypothetical protein EVAR_49271_1 [Eumeta japonica]
MLFIQIRGQTCVRRPGPGGVDKIVPSQTYDPAPSRHGPEAAPRGAVTSRITCHGEIKYSDGSRVAPRLPVVGYDGVRNLVPAGECESSLLRDKCISSHRYFADRSGDYAFKPLTESKLIVGFILAQIVISMQSDYFVDTNETSLLAIWVVCFALITKKEKRKVKIFFNNLVPERKIDRSNRGGKNRWKGYHEAKSEAINSSGLPTRYCTQRQKRESGEIDSLMLVGKLTWV